jgi:hypothetical protein
MVRFLFISVPEKSSLKYQYADNTGRNRCIGQVEDRPEEFKILAAPKWEPGWKLSPEHREVEHVYHIAM